MSEPTFITLVQNAALLLAMAFAFDLAASHWDIAKPGRYLVLLGVMLGYIGVIIMLTPWVLSPGLVFDTRSIMLSVAGLFFGPVPTFIAMFVTGALRIIQGGVGTWVGVTVIITSGSIGLVWRHRRMKDIEKISWVELYVFGLAVHACMLLSMFILPWEQALDTIVRIFLPVAIVYPAATMLLGMLIVNGVRRRREEALIVQQQTILKQSQALAGVGHWVLRVSPRDLHWSDQLYDIFGIDRSVRGRRLEATWRSRLHPDHRRRVIELTSHLPRDGQRLDNEFSIRLPDGSERVVLATVVSPVRDRSGAVHEVMGIVQDITARRADEESILAGQRVTQRMLDEANASRKALLSMMEDQRETERRIRESERRYRELFEGNPHPMWIYDLNTLAFLAVNDAAVAHYGYTRDEFLSLRISDIRPAEDVPRLLQNVAATTQGPQFSGIWKHRKKDGSLIEVEITSHTLDWMGYRAQFVLANDVTLRERAIRDLSENEERLRLAVQSAHQGLFDLDLLTGETIVSPEYATMLGYDPNDFETSTALWLERLHPDDKQPSEDTFRRYVSGSIPAYRIEFRQRTKQGGWKWILSVGRIVEYTDDGRPKRMLGIHTDISERRAIEEALRRSETSLLKAQELAKLGNWQLDLRSGTGVWSAELFRIVGIAYADVPPDLETFRRTVHPDDFPLFDRSCAEVSASGEPRNFDFRLRTPGGTWKDIRCTVRPVQGEDGERKQLFLTLQDVSEPKRHERMTEEYAQRLRKLATHLQTVREQERKEVARELHDELGQQLTAIKMEISLAERQLKKPHGVMNIEDALHPLRGLVDQSVASVRRLSMGLRPDVLDKLGFADAIRSLAYDFSERLGTPCRIDMDGPIETLKDPLAITLYRVIQEGLNNIAKHARATRTEVDLRYGADGWTCEIRDNGVGLDEKKKGRDSIGLVGMRERVEALGGSLEISSSAGKGTVVRVVAGGPGSWL